LLAARREGKGKGQLSSTRTRRPVCPFVGLGGFSFTFSQYLIRLSFRDSLDSDENLLGCESYGFDGAEAKDETREERSASFPSLPPFT